MEPACFSMGYREAHTNPAQPQEPSQFPDRPSQHEQHKASPNCNPGSVSLPHRVVAHSSGPCAENAFHGETRDFTITTLWANGGQAANASCMYCETLS